jgi:Flp pilus assembly protein CpaB
MLTASRVFLATGSVRRAVLRRRRLLAAVLTAVAVAAGLHAVAAPPPPTVPVLVAAHDLPVGAELEAADLVAAEFAPGSAPEDLVDDPVGRTLAAPVRRGEPVTDVRVIGAQLAEGLGGLTALPVRLPDAGMVGLLQVGDRIDLVAADPRGTDAEAVAVDAPVLAIPSEAAGGPGTAGLPGRLVVVGVSPAEVDTVAAAAVGAFVTFTWSAR